MTQELTDSKHLETQRTGKSQRQQVPQSATLVSAAAAQEGLFGQTSAQVWQRLNPEGQSWLLPALVQQMNQYVPPDLEEPALRLSPVCYL